jgi:hypothetical protein
MRVDANAHAVPLAKLAPRETPNNVSGGGELAVEA